MADENTPTAGDILQASYPDEVVTTREGNANAGEAQQLLESLYGPDPREYPRKGLPGLLRGAADIIPSVPPTTREPQGGNQVRGSFARHVANFIPGVPRALLESTARWLQGNPGPAEVALPPTMPGLRTAAGKSVGAGAAAPEIAEGAAERHAGPQLGGMTPEDLAWLKGERSPVADVSRGPSILAPGVSIEEALADKDPMASVLSSVPERARNPMPLPEGSTPSPVDARNANLSRGEPDFTATKSGAEPTRKSVLDAAKPTLNDARDKYGFTVMRSGLPGDPQGLSTALNTLRRAIEPFQGSQEGTYPAFGIYFDRPGSKLERFEDGYSGNTGIRVPIDVNPAELTNFLWELRNPGTSPPAPWRPRPNLRVIQGDLLADQAKGLGLRAALRVQTPQGERVFTGENHGIAYDNAIQALGEDVVHGDKTEALHYGQGKTGEDLDRLWRTSPSEGFVDADGNYHTRDQAAALIDRQHRMYDPQTGRHMPTLTSEELDDIRQEYGPDLYADTEKGAGARAIIGGGKYWADELPISDASGHGYHGSKNDITRGYDLRRAGKSDPGLVGKAMYITPDREQAGQFAMSPHYGRGDAPNVTPVQYGFKNPAIVQDGVLPDGRTLTDAHPRGITKESAAALNKQLFDAGYDGVIFKSGNEVQQVAALKKGTVHNDMSGKLLYADTEKGAAARAILEADQRARQSPLFDMSQFQGGAYPGDLHPEIRTRLSPYWPSSWEGRHPDYAEAHVREQEARERPDTPAWEQARADLADERRRVEEKLAGPPLSKEDYARLLKERDEREFQQRRDKDIADKTASAEETSRARANPRTQKPMPLPEKAGGAILAKYYGGGEIPPDKPDPNQGNLPLRQELRRTRIGQDEGDPLADFNDALLRKQQRADGGNPGRFATEHMADYDRRPFDDRVGKRLADIWNQLRPPLKAELPGSADKGVLDPQAAAQRIFAGKQHVHPVSTFEEFADGGADRLSPEQYLKKYSGPYPDTDTPPQPAQGPGELANDDQRAYLEHQLRNHRLRDLFNGLPLTRAIVDFDQHGHDPSTRLTADQLAALRENLAQYPGADVTAAARQGRADAGPVTGNDWPHNNDYDDVDYRSRQDEMGPPRPPHVPMYDDKGNDLRAGEPVGPALSESADAPPRRVPMSWAKPNEYGVMPHINESVPYEGPSMHYPIASRPSEGLLESILGNAATGYMGGWGAGSRYLPWIKEFSPRMPGGEWSGPVPTKYGDWKVREIDWERSQRRGHADGGKSRSEDDEHQ